MSIGGGALRRPGDDGGSRSRRHPCRPGCGSCFHWPSAGRPAEALVAGLADLLGRPVGRFGRCLGASSWSLGFLGRLAPFAVLAFLAVLAVLADRRLRRPSSAARSLVAAPVFARRFLTGGTAGCRLGRGDRLGSPWPAPWWPARAGLLGARLSGRLDGTGHRRAAIRPGGDPIVSPAPRGQPRRDRRTRLPLSTNLRQHGPGVERAHVAGRVLPFPSVSARRARPAMTWLERSASPRRPSSTPS